MRQAMGSAEVGDDVFGDDPTVNALEDRVADLFGREAALFCPSGTMANQIAIGLAVQPGDEVLMEEQSHTFHFEVGGAARLWGAQPRLYKSDRGTPAPDDVATLVRPSNIHLPKTRLCLVENTHNVHGGAVVALEALRALREAIGSDVRLHLDGARLWNAHAVTGTPFIDYGQVADTLMVAFSKALGCPAGSMVIGSCADVTAGRRLRKLLGGGMRQAGVLAAACHHALDLGLEHDFEFLAADHARARRLAEAFGVDPNSVDTNILIVPMKDPPAAVEKLERAGIRTVPISATAIRLVTHKDITDEHVKTACKAAALVV